MATPLRTAYHCATHSVSSLSSTYSDASSPARSTAPTTPLFRFKDGERYGRSGGRTTFDDGDDDEDDISQASESMYEEDERLMDQADDSDAESVASVVTYASTVASQSQRQRQRTEEYSSMALPLRQNEEHSRPSRHARAMASSPTDFAYYFPSTRLLRISHPDDSVDGNMNLTIETDGWAATRDDPQGAESPVAVPLTLYHLRMHNLKKREFSLRRYSRQSGREVCHSTRRYTRPASGSGEGHRLQRRIGSVLANLRSGTLSRSRKSLASSSNSLKRSDSGYGSLGSSVKGTPGGERSQQDVETGFAPYLADETIHENDETGGSALSTVIPKATNLALPLNMTKLQFSNYMHIDMKRRGGRGRGTKRYDFEHWGRAYSWHRRLVHRTDDPHSDATSVGVEFHLYAHASQHRGTNSAEIAHMVPDALDAREQAAETRAGGWVPRSSMWISDADVISRSDGAELADVIVATGLLALVDDAIKRRWDRKERFLDRMTRSLPARRRSQGSTHMN